MVAGGGRGAHEPRKRRGARRKGRGVQARARARARTRAARQRRLERAEGGGKPGRRRPPPQRRQRPEGAGELRGLEGAGRQVGGAGGEQGLQPGGRRQLRRGGHGRALAAAVGLRAPHGQRRQRPQRVGQRLRRQAAAAVRRHLGRTLPQRRQPGGRRLFAQLRGSVRHVGQVLPAGGRQQAQAARPEARPPGVAGRRRPPQRRQRPQRDGRVVGVGLWQHLGRHGGQGRRQPGRRRGPQARECPQRVGQLPRPQRRLPRRRQLGQLAAQRIRQRRQRRGRCAGGGGRAACCGAAPAATRAGEVRCARQRRAHVDGIEVGHRAAAINRRQVLHAGAARQLLGERARVDLRRRRLPRLCRVSAATRRAGRRQRRCSFRRVAAGGREDELRSRSALPERAPRRRTAAASASAAAAAAAGRSSRRDGGRHWQRRAICQRSPAGAGVACPRRGRRPQPASLQCCRAADSRPRAPRRAGRRAHTTQK